MLTHLHTREAHSCNILFSFHLSFYPAPLLRRSSSLLFFFFFVPPRSVTPACNGRPRRILLISWHATLSPCSAFVSLRRLYPPLRYSLSLLPSLSSPLLGYPSSPSSRVRGAANLFFLRLAREVSSPPSFPLHLFLVFLSYTSRASRCFVADLCPPSSLALPSPLCPAALLVRVLLVHRDSADPLLPGSLATAFRPSQHGETRRETRDRPEGRRGQVWKYQDPNSAPKTSVATTDAV